MPLLDLKVCMGEDGLVKFTFYSKECSSKFRIPYLSAHSIGMKKQMLADEAFIRLVIALHCTLTVHLTLHSMGYNC